MSTLNGASEVFTSTAGPHPVADAQAAVSSPEEIGWYFVESYYTTLNKTPDRLHLFYQKRSSFVWGTEGDNVTLSHGRNEIAERIKQLEFKDCKVRVNNVDSQASGQSGIIVQVLGAMTNNSEPSRRFSQTFFLAEQTNPAGYYVLNDIFRYLKEDYEDEEGVVDAPEEEVAEPVEEAVEETPVEAEKETPAETVEEPESEAAVAVAEEEEEEKVPEPAAPEPEPVTAEAEPEPEKVEEPAATAPAVPAVVPAVPSIPVETAQAEPEATATPEPPKDTAPPQPVVQEAPKPAAKPTSWAALLSGSKPAAAAPTAAPATTTQTAPVAPPAAAATTPSQPASSSSATPSAPANNSGWQTTEPRRQNRPLSMSGAPEKQGNGFVKNVTDRVNPTKLKEALAKFGTLKSFEAVPAKNCAFVEFADPAALVAAAAANPHNIEGNNVFVEERRRRTDNPQFGGGRPGGSFRGGERQGSRGSQRGPGERGDRFDSNRNSFGGGRGGPGGPRGGFSGRGGGRGGSQAATNLPA